jgi:hypothetical protein
VHGQHRNQVTQSTQRRHFQVKDKDGPTSYEATYYNQQLIEWRPFVLSVKSKVKVKLNV